jgi:hypothetical protein
LCEYGSKLMPFLLSIAAGIAPTYHIILCRSSRRTQGISREGQRHWCAAYNRKRCSLSGARYIRRRIHTSVVRARNNFTTRLRRIPRGYTDQSGLA